MASFLFLKRMSDLQLESITAITEPEAPLSDHEAAIMEAAQGRILLYHIEGPLSFGSAKGIVRRLASFKEYDTLVLDLTDVPMVDFTSSRAIDDMINDAKAINRDVYLVGVRSKVRQLLHKQGVLGRLNAEFICTTRKDALCLAAKRLDFEAEVCAHGHS